MTGADIELTARYGAGGYFAIFVSSPGGPMVDVTFFRGVPTKVDSMSWSDPFGPSTAQITFPQITMLERTGTGDMRWLTPFADVTILYFDLNLGTWADWAWEGFIASEDLSDEGVQVTLKGALFQVDNFLAAPRYLQQPMPYELLIQECFDPLVNPSLRTKPLITVFPDDWTETVPVYDAATPWYMKPWGVTPGQQWTGLTSRSTGSWEPKLTGFVQTLLGVMSTPDGSQWTIAHQRGRQPILRVRKALKSPDEKTYVIEPQAHGVSLRLSRDFSQSANVVYAQGQDLAGTQFSGQQVTNDGSTTFYEPFAALPTVYPSTDTNPRLIPTMMRKESMLQLPQGIDELAARDVAATQVRKHADPGFTGSITLESDPILYGTGTPVTRFLIKAGDTLMIKGVKNTNVLVHVTQVSIDIESGKVTITFDSKFRDALTVHEVRARTRDALDPVRMLQAGRYSTTVQDLVKPWSYADGSGVIPSGGAADATKLFTKYMANDAQFPWTDYTQMYPPKNFPEFYIRIPAASSDANKNWSTVSRDGLVVGIPIKMSQAGSIRLTQLAAYDRDGKVKPVSFHVGIYANSGISVTSMPSIPTSWITSPTDLVAAEARDKGFQAGQHYPFFKDAFEKTKATGEQQDQPNYLLAGDAQLVAAWGNYYERAGYSPGQMSTVGRERSTGMMVDEIQWTFDTTSATDFNPYSAEQTAKNANAGMLYVMIYCDDQGDEDVYFLGRLFRTEPTGS